MKIRHFTFEKNPSVEQTSVRFINRFGIELAGDLYVPKEASEEKLPALVITGPFGAVKEQASGLYAQELASRGFVTLAFDPSFTGESGGQVHNVASPEIFTEDFSAAVDFVGLLDNVDRNRIGAFAICGLSGMALTAATVDKRIKAVGTSVMYDISRSISEGVGGFMTPEQREGFLDYLAEQRWQVAESKQTTTGPHEPFFTPDNQVVHTYGLPDQLPEDPHPVLAGFFDYYKTERGYHENSVNSTGAWESRTPLSFLAFPQYAALETLTRPVLFVTGGQAHSRYFSEQAYARVAGEKELIVVPDADHVALYDQFNKIPFDEIARFYSLYLV